MRRTLASLCCALALVLVGCNGDGLPNGVNSPAGSTGGTNGGGTAGGDGGGTSGGGGGGGGGVSDLGTALVDLAEPGAPAGSPCKTACDCQAGLACRQGKCGMSMFGPVYCCSSSNCPNGSFCQTQQGQFEMCGGGGGGGGGGTAPDGGFCQFLPCQSDNGCKMAGCGSCDPATHRCRQ